MGVRGILPPGLFRRITLSFLLVALLSVSVMATLAINSILQTGKSQLQTSLQTNAYSLANLLESPLQAYAKGQGDARLIQTSIEQYLTARKNYYYTLFDASKQVIVSNENPVTIEQYLKVYTDYRDTLTGQEADYKKEIASGEQVYSISVPVKDGSQMVGVLRLAIPIKSNMAGTYKTVWLILIGAGLLLVGVALIGWTSAKTLVAPIHSLISIAEKFSRGELDARADVQGPLEFVQLSEAFNEMAERQQNNMDNLRGFVINASHELRTPLTAIRLNLDALQQGALDEPEVARRFLAQTQEEIDRLNRMVTDLLDLSRIEFNRDNIVFVALDLNQIASEAQQFWSVRARQAGLDLRLIPASQPPFVRANEDQINRVVNNLLDNAIKNTPTGGWVEIAVGYNPGQNHARLEVRDNGRGIAPEHLAHVFERFYRVEKTTPRSGKVMGSGLGLAIARTIMEAHDGSIGATSQVGKGSIFWIELPAVVTKPHK